jgi:cytochrome c
MNKFFAFAFILFTISACNNSSKTTEQTQPATEVTAAPDSNSLSKNPDYQKGLALASKSDCFTCHNIDDKLTGPPYREIANKYANMPDTIITHLAHKVINGGSGVWGQVMMIPHPGISEADAEAMVKYVLLLKK